MYKRQDAYIERTPREKVIDQLVEDLKWAAERMPEAVSYTHLITNHHSFKTPFFAEQIGEQIGTFGGVGAVE